MRESYTKVLLGSPIRQKKEILTEFLSGIEKLDLNDFLKMDYFFIDDNIEKESTEALTQFAARNTNGAIASIIGDDGGSYLCSEFTHMWDEKLIWKVAQFKNSMIKKALNERYDYLFLVDSDLVLHPDTLKQLINQNKDIIAEIFWTRWEPDFPELPQVWMFDQYNLYRINRDRCLTQEEIVGQAQDFIKQLRRPGIYKVGGLGACTLISKKALLAGVNYNEIYNISFVGEDRHFCVRAASLGFDLYVDTHCPALHLYRLADLERLKKSPFEGLN